MQWRRPPAGYRISGRAARGFRGIGPWPVQASCSTFRGRNAFVLILLFRNQACADDRLHFCSLCRWCTAVYFFSGGQSFTTARKGGPRNLPRQAKIENLSAIQTNPLRRDPRLDATLQRPVLAKKPTAGITLLWAIEAAEPPRWDTRTQ